MLSVYTDGSCLGNPGVGGWGYLIVHDDGIQSYYGNNPKTTNNIMELTAVLECLKYMFKEGNKVATIHTDSNYVAQGITKWSKNWIKNKWKTSTGKDVKNKELWKELVEYNDMLDITWVWVKAHDTNYYNNMVDKIALNAAKELQTILSTS
jgi:ribonuclease HI